MDTALGETAREVSQLVRDNAAKDASVWQERREKWMQLRDNIRDRLSKDEDSRRRLLATSTGTSSSLTADTAGLVCLLYTQLFFFASILISSSLLTFVILMILTYHLLHYHHCTGLATHSQCWFFP